MNTSLTNISVNKDFWFQLREYLISFGFNGLPKDIHFTVVFDKKSSDINFHVTKNTGDPKTKPKLTIVKFDRDTFNKHTPLLARTLVGRMITPFDKEAFMEKAHDNVAFIPYDNLEKSKAQETFEATLIASFSDITKLKKQRLKIKGDIEGSLEQFSSSTDMIDSISTMMTDVPKNFDTPVSGGILTSEHETVCVLVINNKWYSFKKDLSPFDMLTAFVSPFLAKRLLVKTKQAISVLQKVDTYNEVKDKDIPIRLVFNEKTDK